MISLRVIAVALLLAAGCTQAADKRRAVPTQSATLQEGIKRIAAAPAQLAELLFGAPVMAAPVDAVQWRNPLPSQGVAVSSMFANATARDDLRQMLVESSFRVWLGNDVNLHCNLEQAAVFGSSDRFVLKLGLQYRFR